MTLLRQFKDTISSMKMINKTILLVEDEEGVRKNIAQFLRFTYSNVIEASNGMEAYDLYYNNRPDLIITDLNMPQMDGFSLIEAIRKDDPHLPIIVISAHSDKEKLLRSIKLHLVDYIIKPVTRSKLKEVVANAFKGHSDTSVSQLVSLGDGFNFDLTNKVLLLNNDRIELTRQQNLLIELLVIHKNHTVSSEDIFFHINNHDYNLEYSNASVRNQVQRIRHALPNFIIKTIYGGGYMLETSSTLNSIDMTPYESLMEAIAICKGETVVNFNTSMQKLLRIENATELSGHHLADFALDSEVDKIKECIQHDTHKIENIYFRRNDGTIFLAKIQSKLRHINGNDFKVITLTDLSDTIKQYSKDPLTALQTRATLQLEFHKLMQHHQYDNRPSSAIFADIDNFKAVNDIFGHQAGDQVLESIAKIFTSELREEDVIVRWGGDEFLILLFNTTLEVTVKISEKLRLRINNLKIDNIQEISCSFGVSEVVASDTLEDLLHRVDTALLQAKKTLKNTTVIN